MGVRLLKQSTAKTLRLGPFLDSTDGVTAETGLTIAQADIQISKNGGAFAQTSDSSPTTTHDTDGWYQLPLTSTDTNTLGPLTVQVVESGALPVWEHFMVVPANVYDSLVGGSDNLEVDVTAVSGDSTAADNLESDYDGTGYTKTNSTIGTVTDVTNAPPSAVSFPTNFSSLAVDGSGQVTVGSVATDAVDAGALATDAVNEIRNAITGGAYSLDTDANGRIRLVSGTSAGEISLSSGAVTVGTNNDKTGYSLSQSFPTNFASLSITAGGVVSSDVNSVSGSSTAANNMEVVFDTDFATNYSTTTDKWQAESDMLSISGSTAAADNLEASAGVIVTGAAQTGTLSTTQMTTDLTETTDDHYNGRVIIWTSGALLGQATDITDYTGSTKLLTFTAVTEAPGNGDTFVIV